MRLILLAILICISGNTYSAIDTNEKKKVSKDEYLKVIDEIKTLEDKIKIMQEMQAEAVIKIMQENRKKKKGVIIPSKSEVILNISGADIVDVGAKIGMTTHEVLSKTNWGKPDYIKIAIDEYGSLEQWFFVSKGYLLFSDDGLLIGIYK